MRLLTTSILSFSFLVAGAQNLVINGEFEPDDCILPAYYISEIIPPWHVTPRAGYWQNLLTTYYGPCTSRSTAVNIPPRTGDGAIGFPIYGLPAFTDIPHESRGYPVGLLAQPLQAGTVYQLSFWTQPVYREDIGMRQGADAPGVLLLSDTNNLNFNNLYILEDDRAIYPDEPVLTYGEWTQVCLSYEARGGERFIVLGNFRSNFDTPIQFLNPDIVPVDPVWDWGYYIVDDLYLIKHTDIPPVLPMTEEMCPDGTVTLEVQHDISGYWDDGSTSNTRTVEEPGVYTFTFLDGYCERTDAVEVVEVNCSKCHVYYPGAFTPDGDGLNDEWKPVFECVPVEYRLEVFDRQGNLVFRTYDHEETWNPLQEIQSGVYVARLRFTYELYGDRSAIDKAVEVVVLK